MFPRKICFLILVLAMFFFSLGKGLFGLFVKVQGRTIILCSVSGDSGGTKLIGYWAASKSYNAFKGKERQWSSKLCSALHLPP